MNDKQFLEVGVTVEFSIRSPRADAVIALFRGTDEEERRGAGLSYVGFFSVGCGVGSQENSYDGIDVELLFLCAHLAAE